MLTQGRTKAGGHVGGGLVPVWKNRHLYTGIITQGTLTGSIATYVLQRRIVSEYAMMARSEKLRNVRLVSCSAFATALTKPISGQSCLSGSTPRRLLVQAPVPGVDRGKPVRRRPEERFNMLLLLREPTIMERLARDGFDSLEEPDRPGLPASQGIAHTGCGWTRRHLASFRREKA
jgi:hypothetical protein